METENENKKQNTTEHQIGKHGERVEVLKQQVANFLNRHTERLSTRHKKWALLFMGILMGGASLTFILKPFQDSSSQAFRLPEEMENRARIIPPGKHDTMFSEEDYLMLLKFKAMVDSLYKADRSTYDEVLKGHEGLLDTIDFLLSIYQ